MSDSPIDLSDNTTGCPIDHSQITNKLRSLDTINPRDREQTEAVRNELNVDLQELYSRIDAGTLPLDEFCDIASNLSQRYLMSFPFLPFKGYKIQQDHRERVHYIRQIHILKRDMRKVFAGFVREGYEHLKRKYDAYSIFNPESWAYTTVWANSFYRSDHAIIQGDTALLNALGAESLVIMEIYAEEFFLRNNKFVKEVTDRYFNFEYYVLNVLNGLVKDRKFIDNKLRDRTCPAPASLHTLFVSGFIFDWMLVRYYATSLRSLEDSK